MKSYKHQLLATSALASAVVIGGGSALAEAMKPSLSLSGFYYMDAHFTDVDGADDNAPMFMVHDSEVHFNASGEMENGIKVGAHIEFEGAGGFRVDDHWITLESGWGRVLLGATDGVNFKTMVTAPSHPYGVTSGLQTDWFHNPDTGKAANTCPFRCALGGARLDAGTDDTGVHYFSPRFNGFQFAVGFRPEATGSGSENRGPINEEMDLHNAADIAVNYAGEMGGVGIKASLAAGGAQAPGGNSDGDYEHVAGGLQLSAMGFTVGGHIADEGTDGPHNGSSFGAGITYSTGPWMVGVDAFSGSIRDGSEPGDSEYDAWSIGGQYTVGPGLRLIAGFQSASVDLDDADALDGSAFTAGVAVNF